MMTDDQPKANTGWVVEKEPNQHISQANSALHENIARLDEALASLIKRVGITLMPESDTNPTDLPPKPLRSALADELWGASDRVFRLTETLLRIVDRIDL